MPSPKSTEGTAPFLVTNVDKDCFTWYKIFGDLSEDEVPVVALHGGPGAGHEYMLAFEDLWTRHGIPVVLYDQIGCGKSTALAEKKGDEAFWNEQLFYNELDNLKTHLKITRFDILGQSWGGMFGSTYAARQPVGLRKLILYSVPASVNLYLRGAAELITYLPQDVQKVIYDCNERSDFESPEYEHACLEFYKRHLCRADPWPPELLASMGHLKADPTVYMTMWVSCFPFLSLPPSLLKPPLLNLSFCKVS